MNICRLCHQHHNSASLVHYARRHYACHACYINSGKPLAKLSKVDLGSFPWRLIRDHDLGAALDALLARGRA